MARLILYSILILPLAVGMDNLRVAYEWKQIDYDFPSDQTRREAMEKGEFIPQNNLPLGLEVYGDRVFITLPRWKQGVAASLAYINLSDPKEAPKLKPYPNWEAHKIREGDTPEIISPFRIRADRCGRLWVVDTGLANLLSEKGPESWKPPRLLIYDLHNDALIRTYQFPESQINNDSFLANIAVEDHDCSNSFAYISDLGRPALLVYSWRSDSSWMVKHHYFHVDPLAGEMKVAGITFVWTDGVFGLALSEADSEGYSTLYFHPMTSFNEFSVSTKVLRNETFAKSPESFHEFKNLGSRGPKSQSGASFLDKNSNVLFYALVNLNAVACWRTTNPTYTMESQGRIFMSNETMVFPNDVKVDSNSNLWVLSDRLPTFMYDKLDYNEVNFRILTEKVSDAIRGTACDSKLVVPPTIVDKIMPAINNKNKQDAPTSGALSPVGSSVAFLIVAIFSTVNNY